LCAQMWEQSKRQIWARRRGILPEMGKPAKIRLRDAIKRLFDGGRTSFNALVASGAVTNGTLGRIVSDDGQDVRLEQLDWLAHALSVEPWQLLHPDPEVSAFSADALKIARAMDDLPPEKRAAAHAVFVQAVEFGNPKPASNGKDGAPSAPAAVKPIRLRRVVRRTDP
jgi:DNA-binding Xre family transcriptional regulator